MPNNPTEMTEDDIWYEKAKHWYYSDADKLYLGELEMLAAFGKFVAQSFTADPNAILTLLLPIDRAYWEVILKALRDDHKARNLPGTLVTGGKEEETLTITIKK